jgi:hypothetical protein
MFSLTYKIQDFSGMKKLRRIENRREGFRENMGENNREN